MKVMAQQEPQRNSNQTKSDTDAGIIAQWPFKRHERLRISLELFNGVWLINIEAESGEWRPSKQRIALSVKHLPQLADAVTKALSIARERGLIPVDSEAAHA
jgi:hypothetical protein